MMISNPYLSFFLFSYISNLANGHEYVNQRSLAKANDYDLDSLYGIMYLDAWLGTPSQRVTLAISLTSDLMVIPCNDVCDSNCEGNPYLSKTSNTFQNVTCDQCSEYLGKKSTCDKDNCLALGSFLDGSIRWDGTLSSDMAYFGGAPVESTPNIAQDYGSRFVFGCQMKYNNYTVVSRWVRKRANGVVSFSPSEHSLMAQLRNSNLLQNKNFALCFYSRLSTVGPAGVLSLGGYTLVEDDESSPLLYLQTKFGRNYAVFIEQVFLHSEDFQNNPVTYANELNNDGNGAILDVGSPVSFLGSDKFGQGFRAAWKKITGQDFPEDGGKFLETDIESLPTIKIQLKATGEKDDNTNTKRHTRQRQRKLEFGLSGVVGKELDLDYPGDVLLTIPPDEYLDYDAISLSYHMRLVLGSPDQPTILGGNLFRSNLLYFDLEESKIGVAKQSYCGRAAVQNADKDGNQFDYNLDEENKDGNEESSNGSVPSTTNNSQSVPSGSTGSDSVDQNSQMSNPISGGAPSTDNTETKTATTEVNEDVDGPESSFSMNITYYIAGGVLFCLFVILGIYSCNRFSKKRRHRQTM